MLLYLDTLKKTCFQKKKKEKKRKSDVTSFKPHTTVTLSLVCYFVFWAGTGVGTEDLFFRTHTSTRTVSHSSPAAGVCSCFCMDHPVTIICKQCGEGRRDEESIEIHIHTVHILSICVYIYIYGKEFFFFLYCYYVGVQGAKLNLCLILPLASPTIHIGDSKCQLGVRFSLHVCCYLRLTLSPLLLCLIFFFL